MVLSEFAEFFGHCLPVGSSPVNSAAGGALHILVLRFENIGRYVVFYLVFTSVLQGLVAFQAESEWLEMAIQIQRVYYLSYLGLWFIIIYQYGFESPAGDDASFHNLSVPG